VCRFASCAGKDVDVNRGPDGRLAEGNVFVGRERELAALRAAWELSRQRSAQIVGIEGSHGIGKTALIQRLLAEIPGTRVVHVSGDEDEAAVPWGVLRELARQLPESGIGELADGLDPRADPIFVGQSLMRNLQSGDELVVVIDDAHWGDRESMAALRFVVRRLRFDPVLVLVAYRPAGTTVEPAYLRRSPGLHEAWRRIFEGGNGIRLRLDGLTAAELMRLAADTGHPGLSPAGAARLRKNTDGNPLHASELLSLLSMRSIMAGTGPLPVPRDIASAITSRLASCARSTRELVAAGAVLGRRFSLASARAVAGADAVGELVTEAVEAGLLAEVPGTAGRDLAFPSSLIRDVVYHDLSRVRRSQLHRSCATLGGAAALRHRIAAADGVDTELAADLERAARDLMDRGELARAADLLHHALDLTPNGPERTARLLTAVEALLVAGDAVSARDYEGEIAAGPGGPWQDYVAGYQILLTGRIAEAKALFLRAATAIEEGAQVQSAAPPDLTARILTQLAIIGVVALSYPEMVEYGTAAVAAGTDEPWVAAFAWFAKSIGLALAGRSEAALDELTSVDVPGAASGLDGLVARGMIRLWTDDLDGALQDLGAAVHRATGGEALRISQGLGFLGEVEYRRGRLGEAVLYTELAVGGAVENGRVWDLAVLHALASYPHAARADWTTAEHHAAESANWAAFMSTRVGLAFAAASRAAIAQARGDAARLLTAAEDLESVYDSLEPGTHLFGPIRADALAQLGRADEAAAALAAFVAGPLRRGRRSALMSTARVRAQIAIARGQHEQALAECETALDLADAVGLPLEAGRVEMLAATCHGSLRRRAAAERALRRAWHRFTLMGADAYVALAGQAADRLGLQLEGPAKPFSVLTRAERDIALLVCDGYANKEIAARLFLSVKTVETHLTHVYQKLNVSSRAALRSLTGDAG
jgi:DNA-binding CsgD family transcriptional regulator